MPHYKVQWSEYQEPWIIESLEKLGEFVTGLLTDADDRLPVGARITIDVIAPTPTDSRDAGKPLVRRVCRPGPVES